MSSSRRPPPTSRRAATSAASKVNTASGDVTFEQVGGEAQVNSASGDVKLEEIGGALTVNTASGDVEIGRLGGRRQGPLRFRRHPARRGRLVARRSRPLPATSRSRACAKATSSLQTASGDIEVGIKQGSKLWIDAKSMSGETTLRARARRRADRRRRPDGRGSRHCHERRHHGQARLETMSVALENRTGPASGGGPTASNPATALRAVLDRADDLRLRRPDQRARDPADGDSRARRLGARGRDPDRARRGCRTCSSRCPRASGSTGARTGGGT